MTVDKISGKRAGMKDFRSALISFAAFACVLSLAACGGGHPKTGGSDLPADLTLAPLQNCPQTAILRQTQTVTVFLPGRDDIAAQRTTAKMDGLSGACTVKKADHALEVKFTVNFAASNGPANAGQPIILPWFVAITRGDHIIEERDYTATMKFNGNMSVAVATSKPVKIDVPDQPDSAQIEILTGFRMSQAQRAYAAAHPNAGLLP